MMRAVVIDHPGEPEVLQLRTVPVPSPKPGWVLVRVLAFGLNRSELHFRQGVASTGSFPRIPGIEATGVVAAAPGGEFEPGAQVVTMMGGMGRLFDGGYAEFVTVPASQVIPFRSELPWSTLGAVPEMLQTAYGSLEVGLQALDGQSLLIRGGTSSIGMADRRPCQIARHDGVSPRRVSRRTPLRWSGWASTTSSSTTGRSPPVSDGSHLPVSTER